MNRSRSSAAIAGRRPRGASVSWYFTSPGGLRQLGLRLRWFTLTRDGRRRLLDWTMVGAALLAVLIALVPLISILWTSVVRSLPVFESGPLWVSLPTFLTASSPRPCSSLSCVHGGIGNAIEGTLLIVGLASLIALPLGILTGIYLSEYGNHPLGRGLRFFIDVMTGVPSIVVGIFAFTLFLYAFNQGWIDYTYVNSAVSGAFALSIIMVPIVGRTSDEALRLVSTTTREAGLALGLPKWKVVSRIVLSSGRTAVVTGALLGLSRAAGETAPLLMTAQGSPYAVTALNERTQAMPLLIYQYGLSGYSNWVDDAWGAALVLVLLMLGINVAARLALRWSTPEGGVR